LGSTAGGKVATAARTTVAAGLVAAPVAGAVKGAEFLATHSAMKEVEKREAERKEQAQP
jgi:hypothetical protein